MTKQSDWIARIAPAAQAVSAQTGMSYQLMLAQAAQETGWGQKVLTGSNNLFNVKADSSWTGATITLDGVSEFKNGQWVTEKATFRVYGTIEEAFQDRVKFLQENPRYAAAGLFSEGVKGNFEAEAAALQKAGYATDPNYAKNLIAVGGGKTMREALDFLDNTTYQITTPDYTPKVTKTADGGTETEYIAKADSADGCIKKGDLVNEVANKEGVVTLRSVDHKADNSTEVYSNEGGVQTYDRWDGKGARTDSVIKDSTGTRGFTRDTLNQTGDAMDYGNNLRHVVEPEIPANALTGSKPQAPAAATQASNTVTPPKPPSTPNTNDTQEDKVPANPANPDGEQLTIRTVIDKAGAVTTFVSNSDGDTILTAMPGQTLVRDPDTGKITVTAEGGKSAITYDPLTSQFGNIDIVVPPATPPTTEATLKNEDLPPPPAGSTNLLNTDTSDLLKYTLGTPPLSSGVLLASSGGGIQTDAGLMGIGGGTANLGNNPAAPAGSSGGVSSAGVSSTNASQPAWLAKLQETSPDFAARLTPSEIATISQSPIAVAQIEGFVASGGAFTNGAVGGGSDFTAASAGAAPSIRIDGGGTGNELLRLLSHELGHAVVPPQSTDGTPAGQTWGQLRGEGEAVYNEFLWNRDLVEGRGGQVCSGGFSMSASSGSYQQIAGYIASSGGDMKDIRNAVVNHIAVNIANDTPSTDLSTNYFNFNFEHYIQHDPKSPLAGASNITKLIDDEGYIFFSGTKPDGTVVSLAQPRITATQFGFDDDGNVLITGIRTDGSTVTFSASANGVPNGANVMTTGGGSAPLASQPEPPQAPPSIAFQLADTTLSPAQQIQLTSQLEKANLTGADITVIPLQSGGYLITNSDGDIVGSAQSPAYNGFNSGVQQITGPSGAISYVNASGQIQTEQQYAAQQAQNVQSATDLAGAIGITQSLIGLQNWDKMSDLGRLQALTGLYNQIDNLGATAAGGNLPGNLGQFGAALGLISALEGHNPIAIATASASLYNTFANVAGSGLDAVPIPIIQGLNLINALEGGNPWSIAASAIAFVPGWGTAANKAVLAIDLSKMGASPNKGGRVQGTKCSAAKRRESSPDPIWLGRVAARPMEVRAAGQGGLEAANDGALRLVA